MANIARAMLDDIELPLQRTIKAFTPLYVKVRNIVERDSMGSFLAMINMYQYKHRTFLQIHNNQNVTVSVYVLLIFIYRRVRVST